MNKSIEINLQKFGFRLPEDNAPGANYLPYKTSGKTLYMSGQLSKQNGDLIYKGAVGKDVTLKEGIKAAEVCM